MSPTHWESSRWRVALSALASLKIAVLVVGMDWTARTLSPFDLTKSVFSRWVEWAIGGVLLVAIARWGWGLWPRARVHAAVALFLGVNLLAAVLAEDRFVAFFGAPAKYLGVTFLVDMAVLYLAVAASFRTARDWVGLFVAGGVSFVVSAGYAFVQILGRDPLPWSAASNVRPFSTVGNPDTYAQFLSVAIAASLGALVLYRGPRQRLVRIAAACIALAALALSGWVAARAVILGIVAALVLTPVLYWKLYGRATAQTRRTRLALALTTVALLVALAVSPLGQRLVATAQGAALRERVLVWEVAVRAFAARPVLGYGVDSFGVIWPRYRPAEFVRLAPGIGNDSGHSWLLQAAATTGAAGVASLLALQIVALRALATRGLKELPFVSALLLIVSASYWAHGIVSVGTVAVDWVPWVVAGGAAAITGSGPRALPAKRRIPALGAALVVAGAVAAGATGLSSLAANREALATRHAADLGQGSEATTHGRSSVALDSGRADYWNELGRAYFVASRLSDSADAFVAAHERAPADPLFLSNLGRALAQLARAGDTSRGGSAAALEAAQRAVDLDPNNPEPKAAFAEIAIALGSPDVALRASGAAFALLPEARYVRLAISAATTATDLGSAREILEMMVATSESPALRVSIAQIAVRQGDRVAAVANAKRALQLEPNNATALAIVRDLGG